MGQISENVKALLSCIPEGVLLVAATKGRTTEEIREAISAGIKIIGENYLQETERKFREIGRVVQWHYIGSVQRRKIKKLVDIFDMIETIDSFSNAEELDKICNLLNIKKPVLVEVNSGREPNKSGVMPEDVVSFIRVISGFEHISVQGLMTMGPLLYDPEKYRPYFSLTRELFEEINERNFQNVEMKYLSMGMSASFKVAIDEGANIVRIGTLIFGPRE